MIKIQVTPFVCPGNLDTCLSEYPEAVRVELKERLGNGDNWAWCDVEVKAWSDELPGVIGDSWIIASSYDDQYEFERTDAYRDLRRDAIDNLHDALSSKLESVRAALVDCWTVNKG